MELFVLAFVWGLPLADLVRMAIIHDAQASEGEQSVRLRAERPISYPDAYCPAPGERVPFGALPGGVWAP